ncbi:hypothetical protein DPX16_16352 [Anabarilius grahami]|uniref:Uncharacterized protein n=1 Tax=Anabarilius grahami TaxID=495550 RepID=A0A3N0XK62_ANAGA|nr:hypothetical protein DPX16_16352 [Anabarilius grahami]
MEEALVSLPDYVPAFEKSTMCHGSSESPTQASLLYLQRVTERRKGCGSQRENSGKYTQQSVNSKYTVEACARLSGRCNGSPSTGEGLHVAQLSASSDQIHSLNGCQGDRVLTYRGRGGIDPCQGTFAAFGSSAVAFHSAAVSQVSSRLSSSLRRSFVSPPSVHPHFSPISPSLHP